MTVSVNELELREFLTRFIEERGNGDGDRKAIYDAAEEAGRTAAEEAIEDHDYGEHVSAAVEEEVDQRISDFDFTELVETAVAEGIADYDFTAEVEAAVETAVNDYDFTAEVESAVEGRDFSYEMGEAVNNALYDADFVTRDELPDTSEFLTEYSFDGMASDWVQQALRQYRPKTGSAEHCNLGTAVEDAVLRTIAAHPEVMASAARAAVDGAVASLRARVGSTAESLRRRLPLVRS